MSTTVLGDQYVTIGVGTTAQRPASPVQGMVRYNTTTTQTEIYNGSQWVPVSPISFNALSVDASGNLLHNQVMSQDSNTTVDPSQAMSSFFSGALTLSIDSLGNLTSTH